MPQAREPLAPPPSPPPPPSAAAAACTLDFSLTGGLRNGLIALNRYISNISSDYSKQHGE
jgi:hypothetical protein